MVKELITEEWLKKYGLEFSPDHLANCCIPYETESIKYYAWEIGQMQRMIEKEKDEKQMQWWQFFKSFAETELENANERLTKYRQQLVSFRNQRKELSGLS